MSLLSSGFNLVNSTAGMFGAVGGAASGKASNAANEQATSNYANQNDAINTETLDARTSQAKQMADLANQAAEDGIAGSKTKIQEARMKRSNDTVSSMGQIG